MPAWLLTLVAGVISISGAVLTAVFARAKDKREADQTDRKLSWQEVQDVMDMKDQERDYWHQQAMDARAEAESARKARDECLQERFRLWRIVEGRWGSADSDH